MVSSSDKIQQLAIQFLHKIDIKYIAIGKASFNTKNGNDKQHPNDYWVVPYTYKVFEEEEAFVHIDDITQKALYATTKHGYIYPDTAKDTAEEDDDESWDDL